MRPLTPAGRAGVACYRFAAHERAALFACLRRPGGRPLPDEPGAGALRRAELWLDGRAVDDVLLVEVDDGACELHTHGAPALVELLAAAFPWHEEPIPDPAERLRRTALSVEQLDLALEQRDGAFAGWLAALANLPAEARAAAIAAAQARSAVALAHAQPARLVLVGAQNAGKSTLFNALLGRERVLTGAMPGLTRDPVAEATTLAGYPYELVDTAGLGSFHSELDARAFARGQLLRGGALVVLVVAGDCGPGAAERALAADLGAPWTIATKADLAPAPWPDDWPTPLRVSALGSAVSSVRQAVGAWLRDRRGLPPAGPVGGPAALDEVQWQALTAMADVRL